VSGAVASSYWCHNFYCFSSVYEITQTANGPLRLEFALFCDVSPDLISFKLLATNFWKRIFEWVSDVNSEWYNLLFLVKVILQQNLQSSVNENGKIAHLLKSSEMKTGFMWTMNYIPQL
jgi:hypothetical protein